ncbi:MAG: S-methyl-5-thioribose-1-phosphate isomerase [Bacteroidetes bacterium]|jgi:methylthioribose-1-phosphate isomerase|nr:S-methyl-5-thioribose-1-phosphate isomerase [Bacteroidota bacterium]MBT6687814.1 S-methyl-5-thioribose-1-phosphate isomerase [Bacteroidota bacterium]MBT7143483.1 S-methyl-5-thioribose-1-phosphate isomerase [Bacteroidota bacterium]MBT7493149.1 S-methyl-5-thioribose-1-phosphate isomerase [Bacteroidota bacterium]
MQINGKHFRAIWFAPEKGGLVKIIDQRKLPFQFQIVELQTAEECIRAISEMYVRGAPLIGVTAAYGLFFALKNMPENAQIEEFISKTIQEIKASRPTAVNLEFCLEQVNLAISKVDSLSEKTKVALETANEIAENEVDSCRKIGKIGFSIIEEISRKKNGETVNILTHCNAGWLACVDYGTATAPMYEAAKRGIKIHVWVDETRPRNQGSRLTAWELENQKIDYTIIADNTGGYLMQHKMVDLVIVGSDRTTRTGDVCNKIGTYLKALAASDNNVPFYVALPTSTFDMNISDGVREIPIEKRNQDEVKYIEGFLDNRIEKVLLTPENSCVANYSFDVTPARLVTALITEKGICLPNEDSIRKLIKY